MRGPLLALVGWKWELFVSLGKKVPGLVLIAVRWRLGRVGPARVRMGSGVDPGFPPQSTPALLRARASVWSLCWSGSPGRGKVILSLGAAPQGRKPACHRTTPPSAELCADLQGLPIGLSHLLALQQGQAAVSQGVLPPAPQGPASRNVGGGLLQA